MTDPTKRFMTKANFLTIVTAMKSKYTNKNAFGRVAAGGVNIDAEAESDTLNIVGGTNVTVTPDASTDTLTIAATDTTYSAAVPSVSGVGGTDGLITAADQEKLNGIAAVNGIVKENGSGTASAASASDVVTLLGITAVNRATADASGNNIANTYATQSALSGKADANHTHSGYQTQHTTATASLTTAGWSNDSQTVSAAGVTASNTVIVAPAPASAAAWAAAGIVCTAQGAGTLTFTCTTAPTDALTANVLVLGGGLMLYSISNDSPSVMSVDKSYAAAGDTVTVTNLTSSALPWTLNGVSQTDLTANGTVTFTMPASDVVVAEAILLYSITNISPSLITINKASAQAGETVTVTALEDEDGVAYWTINDVEQSGGIDAGDSATFTMPASAVVVYASDHPVVIGPGESL